MNVWTLKLISIPIVAAVNFISGFLPYFFISRKIRLANDAHKYTPDSQAHNVVFNISPRTKRYLTLANFFSAGVFLSTCFIGLYPGVNRKFSQIIRQYPSVPHYPWAGLSLACGFFLVWMLEIVVHLCVHCHGHGHAHSSHTSVTNSIATTNNINNNTNSTTIPMTNTPTGLTQLSSIEEKLLTNDDGDMDGLHTKSSLDGPHHLVTPRTESVDHEAHSHVPLSGNLLGSIMLTFALGSHSIIEGLGFGVMDDLTNVMYMIITVLIHEAVCATSLGVNIASRNTATKPAVVLLAIFSILIPVGIGLGLILDVSLQKNLFGDVMVAVLQGVAAGTFIYVVFMEILPNEMSHRKDALVRLVVMILGFAVIAIMKTMHSHADSSGSSSVATSNHSIASLATNTVSTTTRNFY